MTQQQTRLDWRAGADLIAHAFTPRTPRTLCGKPVVLERLAHPEQRRCLTCTALAGVA